jgi:hypothetical protein
MARSLTFNMGNTSFQCGMEKIDRNKLYGWVDTVAYDKAGQECTLGSISSDGMHVFSKGCFEQGYLDMRGHWVDKDQMQMLDADNQPLVKHESSFNQAVALADTVPVDTYLAHVIKSVYQLEADAELIETVKKSEEIFCFPFNYYASYQPDTAFLIESDGNLFMAIGQHAGFDFVEMQQIDNSILEDDEDDEESNDEDEIDFSMF